MLRLAVRLLGNARACARNRVDGLFHLLRTPLIERRTDTKDQPKACVRSAMRKKILQASPRNGGRFLDSLARNARKAGDGSKRITASNGDIDVAVASRSWEARKEFDGIGHLREH
jgi:hypothetical protein